MIANRYVVRFAPSMTGHYAEVVDTHSDTVVATFYKNDSTSFRLMANLHAEKLNEKVAP